MELKFHTEGGRQVITSRQFNGKVILNDDKCSDGNHLSPSLCVELKLHESRSSACLVHCHVTYT